MSSVLVIDCPHCSAENSAFTLHGDYPIPGMSGCYWALFKCPVCHGGVSAQAMAGKTSPGQLHGLINDGFATVSHFPKRAPVDAPEHLPADVQRLYLRAAGSLRSGDNDAAAMLIRKTLEVALGQRFGLMEGTLAKRINQLASDHRLTPDMACWADEIRLDGNAAAHESSEPDPDNTRQLLTFLHVFLLYVFTLPAMVAARKANS